MLHSLILDLINKVKNNNKYVLTLSHELQAHFSTEAQTSLVSMFPRAIPYGYFKYNISKMTPTSHDPSIFFIFFYVFLKLIQWSLLSKFIFLLCQKLL